MEDLEKAKIFFHLIEEEKVNPPLAFSVHFEFDKKRIINTDIPFEIEDKYFSKIKDKLLTFIILNIDDIQIKFLITLYYAINHITIFKTKRIGVLYEIIQIVAYDEETQLLNQITFDDCKKNKIKVENYDTIGNKFRERFLIVNCPVKIDLPIKFNNIKEHSSYKIVILPKNIILVHEIKEPGKIIKVNLDLNEFLVIQKRIEKLFEKYDKKEMEDISIKLKKYDIYFRQNLLNKEDFEWKYDELCAFYFYHAFHLFILSKTEKQTRKMRYYRLSLNSFKENYMKLFSFYELNIYDKILAVVSLYLILTFDSRRDENKNFILGEYELIISSNLKYECYKYAFEFINKIIDELKEDSFIFLPLLQVNSGYSLDLNTDGEKKEIFELSMINVKMIQRHLKYLMPKFIFKVNHPSIQDTRGATFPTTGIIFIYETSIFNNNINYEIEDYKNLRPKDAAINVSFTLSHEMFMHKKLRAEPSSDEGKKTPTKFIGKQFAIESFFYSQGTSSILAIYTKNKKKLNTEPSKGESGRIFEYFFEIKDKYGKESQIISILKKYYGFGDLIDKVELIVNTSVKQLHEFINQQIRDNKAGPLVETKILNVKRKRSQLNDNTLNNNIESELLEEEFENEEEESEEDDDLPEEEKYALNTVLK